ncbi:universal stress protein [Arcticibacter sp.]|jgi:nucleotide-binding universal stress UspA family protein|uniref:universal stress protein n=1 Tax=Arcticibacter sp. TaxID=1872630 RepID=UPI00388D5EEB
MKTIIVATDLSKDANNALEYAAALARLANAKLVLYNSFVIPPHAANTLLPASGIEKMIASNKASLEYIALKTSVNYDIEVITISKLADLQEELDKLVAEYKAEVVVMGMRGDSIDQKLFGNTTTSIIAHATYPVLVIPQEAKFKGMSKILFACDEKCPTANTTLSRLREIASDMKAEVQVLHVDKLIKKANATLRTELSGNAALEEQFQGVSHSYREIDGGSIIEGIEKGIEEYNADLLVMVPQKYGLWDSIVHRSKTRIMASRSKVPLLSIPFGRN